MDTSGICSQFSNEKVSTQTLPYIFLVHQVSLSSDYDMVVLSPNTRVTLCSVSWCLQQGKGPSV